MHPTSLRGENQTLPASGETTTTATRPIISTEATPINVVMDHLGRASPIGDPFDGSAEPVIYMSENRMPVVMELRSIIIYIIFAALLLALFSILPGVRRTKLSSFTSLVTMIVVGAAILLSIEGSHWLTGVMELKEMPYGALTSETISGQLEVSIGLSSTNVTLVGRLMGQLAPSSDGNDHTNSENKLVNYNERFYWTQPDRMAAEHTEALRRGLPYPILTITEFLSQDSDGFSWMRQLRHAGYFTALALYASLASWCLTVLVMCALPVYLPHMMQITGTLLMGAVWIYTLLINSPKNIVIQLGESPMVLAFGFTYVLTFMAGALSMFSGVLMFIIQANKPHESLTIMDCDSFANNRKALYPNFKQFESRDGKAPKEGIRRQDSVIIPIADILDKYATTKQAAKQ